MKKTITVAMMLALVVPAQASEIPGTRVEGQGAVCVEGQGKALEVNIALKKEFSYCIELPKPKPTPTPTPTPVASVTPTPVVTSTPTPVTNSEPNTNQTTVVAVTESTTVTVADTTTVTTVETQTVTMPTPTPTAVVPSPPAQPVKSNVITANATTGQVTVREETDLEVFARWYMSWSSWFNELMRWFASLG